MMMHDHNLRYLLLTYLSQKRWLSLENFQGLPYATSSNIFFKSFKQIKAYISPKNIEVYTIKVLCDTQATYRTIEVIAESWKSPKDVLIRCPATYFALVLNWLASTNLPKKLNCIQYRLLCVTEATYRAIKVMSPEKVPRTSLWDVLQHILHYF